MDIKATSQIFGKNIRPVESFGIEYLSELTRIFTTYAADRPKSVLEWGMGYSTLFFLQNRDDLHIKELYSIDHTRDYFEQIISELPKWEHFHATLVDLTGPKKSFSDPEPNYSTYPLTLNKKFDVIYIDGRRRMECAFHTIRLCHPDTIVILHDYRRNRYQNVELLYDVIENGNQYRVMKPNPGILALVSKRGITENSPGFFHPRNPLLPGFIRIITGKNEMKRRSGENYASRVQFIKWGLLNRLPALLPAPKTAVPGNIIWQFWDTGIENAPELIRICVASVARNKGSHQHLVLTDETFKNYITFPDYILSKWYKIDPTKRSNLIRLALLSSYGGVWLDATCYLCGELPEYLFRQNLFFFTNNSPDRLIRSWLIQSSGNNYIISGLLRMHYRFYQEFTEPPSYFFFHYFFEILQTLDPLVRNEWDQLTKRDVTPGFGDRKELIRKFLVKEELLEFLKQYPIIKFSNRNNKELNFNILKTIDFLLAPEDNPSVSAQNQALNPETAIVQDKNLTVVAGMHRSGTSFVTRALKVLGISLGDNLLEAAKGDNDKGYWEDKNILSLNNEMLRATGNHPHFLKPVSKEDFTTLRIQGFPQRITYLLNRKTSQFRKFGFKDPRMAKLLPVWKEAFEINQYKVHYIVVLRHPVSVASSLKKRNEFETSHALLQWLDNVLSTFTALTGEKWIITDYDTFLHSPEKELQRISSFTGFSVKEEEYAIFIKEFVSPELRHNFTDADLNPPEGSVSALALKVYRFFYEISDSQSIDSEIIQQHVCGFTDNFKEFSPLVELADHYTGLLFKYKQKFHQKNWPANEPVAITIGHEKNQELFKDSKNQEDQLKIINPHDLITQSGLFDKDYYLKTNPDVKVSGIDPVEHYVSFGWKEGRNPGPDFDTRFYLVLYQDVESAGINPLIHFIRHGKKENRLPNPMAIIQGNK